MCNLMTDKPDLTTITLDDLIDVAILSHGFLPYKRDYFFHIETLWKENYAGQYLLTFTHCYHMQFKTITGSETLKQSWDDCFINQDKWTESGEPEGYCWWTNYMNSYPGFSQVDNSELAKKFSAELGKEMKELKVEAEIFQLNLLFHEWTIKKLNSDTELVSQYIFPLK